MLRRMCDRCRTDLGMVDPDKATEINADTTTLVTISSSGKYEVCKKCATAIVYFIVTEPIPK